MKFPFFASFILFCIFLTITIKRQNAEHEKKESDFWDKERLANAARRQPLDNLPFIHIPFDHLIVPKLSEIRPKDSSSGEAEEPSFDKLSPMEKLTKLYATLEELDRDGIVNFSGKTNTDLKMEYGVANLDTLTQYDQNYMDTLIGLDTIAHLLAEEGFETEALTYLEYAVSLKTDISTTYELLVTLYRKQGLTRKIENLVPIAKELKSMQKEKILRLLTEI